MQISTRNLGLLKTSKKDVIKFYLSEQEIEHSVIDLSSFGCLDTIY